MFELLLIPREGWVLFIWFLFVFCILVYLFFFFFGERKRKEKKEANLKSIKVLLQFQHRLV